jgi:hypothetical protein
LNKKIRYSLGRRLIRRFMQQNDGHGRAVPNYDESKTFLLLISSDVELKNISPLITKLKSDGKDVHTIIYYPKAKDVPTEAIDNVIYLSRKDFNYLGSPKTEHSKTLLGKPYDFLINLDMHGHLPVKAVAAFTKAVCRVGFNRDRHSSHFYDLCFGKRNSGYQITQFMEDINTYLHRMS